MNKDEVDVPDKAFDLENDNYKPSQVEFVYGRRRRPHRPTPVNAQQPPPLDPPGVGRGAADEEKVGCG
jgi:hypothetical protein